MQAKIKRNLTKVVGIGAFSKKEMHGIGTQ